MNLEPSSAHSLLEQAEQLFKRNEFEQACQLYIQVCQADPRQLQAWLQLANAEYSLDQFIRCLEAVEQALGLDANNQRALLIGSAALLELGQFTEAVRLADNVLALDANQVIALLNKSTALLRLNKIEEALAAADHALTIDSQQVTAYMNRGSALLSLGQQEPALLAFDQALALRPGYANALINRSSVLSALGRHAEALQSADEALAAQPNVLSALLNRAAALLGLQRPGAALETLDRILVHHPRHLKALLNKSKALQELKRFEEALQVAETALTVDPMGLTGWQNKLQALLGMKRYEDALAELQHIPETQRFADEIQLIRARALLALRRYEETSLALDPLLKQDPPTIGAILIKIELFLWLQQNANALACVEQGLTLYPDDKDLLLSQVSVLLLLNQNIRALATVERVLALDVAHTKALMAKATVLIALGRFQEALRISDRLLSREGLEWQIYANLGGALAGLQRFAEARDAFANAERLDKVAFRDNYQNGPFNFRPADSVTSNLDPRAIYTSHVGDRLTRCEWADYLTTIHTIRELVETALAEGADMPLDSFQALSLPLPPSLQLAVARSQAERIKSGMAEIKRSQSFIYVNESIDKLKIGYVSADFCNHPTAHLMRSVFRLHDRQRFEIHGYALSKDDNSVYYRQIKADCDHFVDLTEFNNAQAARRIHQDGIHLLVDLMAYTKDARTEIFALQPAPIQVNYLGFPGTMGADFIHYIVADPVVLPLENAQFFSEQPVYLPDCYQVNDHWQEIAETGISRSDQGLPERGFVFCCFNQAYKLDPVMFAVWMRILKQVPESILWLYATNDEVKDNLHREAEMHGVAGERLLFAQRLPKDRHLERHRLADLFLDTRIYNAHTTASDALWGGLPVLTCKGQTFAGRVGASLLQAVGLPELITETLEEYERKAVHLATHPEELAGLRSRLAANRLQAPLFDTERFVRHLEQAYRMMWERYEKGQAPQAIWVGDQRAAASKQPEKSSRRFWHRWWPGRGH